MYYNRMGTMKNLMIQSYNNITQLPSDFKQKCETRAGQKEMLALADKYIKMKTSDSEIDKIYKTLGLYIKEKCYNSSTKRRKIPQTAQI